MNQTHGQGWCGSTQAGGKHCTALEDVKICVLTKQCCRCAGEHGEKQVMVLCPLSL